MLPKVREGLECFAAAVNILDAGHNDGPHFSDSGLALVAAIDGLGIALASKPLVAKEIAEGRLVAPFAISVGQHYP